LIAAILYSAGKISKELGVTRITVDQVMTTLNIDPYLVTSGCEYHTDLTHEKNLNAAGEKV
jgi:hypothetical protein